MCRLLKCEYGDIISTDIGRIVEVVDDGYGIEFFKKFKNSADNNFTEEKRVIFGYAKDVILL